MTDDGAAAITRWPELVGATAAEAEAYIRRNHPEIAQITAVPPHHAVTADFRTNRVWLHVNADGIVNAVPEIG